MPGHVIGLLHEHQRPDARQSLRYDCSALVGYAEAERVVSTLVPAQQPEFRPFMPLEDNMRMVCTQPALARKYFPLALSYMPRDDHSPTYQASPQFDIDSLMLFSSGAGRAQGARSYPLLTARGSMLYSGGNPDPNRAGLSQWTSNV